MTVNIDFLLVLLVCFLINVKSGESFGLDVHHRYSDTVREFLSHDGLPAQGTFDYYATMAHRDHLFKARRLADGSSTSSSSPFLTFSGGNSTFQLSTLGFLHYVVVTVGTPPLVFLVALDTGSSVFWLPCDCPNCAHDFNIYGQKKVNLSMYSPSKSSTSFPVPCNSTLCSGRGRGCLKTRNVCSYQQTYPSIDTSSSGILVDDILNMGTDENPQNLKDLWVTLGCGMNLTGDFLESLAINGMLGLGMSNISVPSILASKKVIAANSFSWCFASNGIGRIDFGDKGSPDQKVTPFNLQQLQGTYNVTVTQIGVGTNVTDLRFDAIFDSGLAYTYLTDPAFTFLAESFNSKISEQRLPINETVFDYCYALSSIDAGYSIPRLNFTMKGGDQINVTGPTVLISRKEGGYGYCLAVLRSSDINVIGQNFMTGYEFVFDREDMVLGWKESDCSGNTQAAGKRNSTTTPPPSPVVSTRSPGSAPPPLLTRPPPGNSAPHLSSMAANIFFGTILSVLYYLAVI